MIEETIENFIVQGAVKLAIINTGVSTEPVIRIAVREILERSGIRVPVADIRRLGKSADLLMQQKLGGHGDEHETSLMLAIKPEAVRMDEAQTDYGHLLDAPRTVFDLPAIFDPNPASGIDYSAAGDSRRPHLGHGRKGACGAGRHGSRSGGRASDFVPGSGSVTDSTGYDVLVIGCGYAGAMSALAAQRAGASVCVLEKAPHPGGISICSAGGLRIARNADDALRYLEATNAGRTPRAVLAGLAHGMTRLPDRVRGLG